MAHKFKAIATPAVSPRSTHTVPGPPSLPPSPPGSPHPTRAGPAVFPSSATYPALSAAFTPHTAAIWCSATRDLPSSPPPFETRPSPGYLDPEIGFANGAPPRWLNVKLSAALASLTWPAIAAAKLVSSIWHISHAAWNKLQHSIHGNGTTPPPHRPTANNGDPFFDAFAGRNQARALHNADVARRRPPPTRRTNQPRRPTEQIAPALGVLLTRAASLRATEPLTQGALLDRIFSNGFHIANAHAVDEVPNTAGAAPPPPPLPAHRRNCSLCAGRHLNADCELIHGPLPSNSNRRSCANCSGRHWDDYCPFSRVDLPRAPAFPDIDAAPNNRPPASSDDTSHPRAATSLSDIHIRNAAVQHILAGGSPLPSLPAAPSPPIPHPPATSTSWPAATRAAYTSHNAQIANDTLGPPGPAPACADEIHYSIDGDAWLAGAPSRTTATLRCASTTSATFSTSKDYAWTSSKTPSANTI